MKLTLKAFLQPILSFFLGGELCICCGEFSFYVPLCKTCIQKRLLTWEPSFSKLNERLRCKVCGNILVSEEEICFKCRSDCLFKNTDKIFPIHTYRLWKKNLLFLWKSSEMRHLSIYFADLINKVIESEFYCEKKIPLVPVPPRFGKIYKKGWDQIAEICFLLEKKYGFTILNLLERTTIQQQKKLDRNHRLENLGSAYKIKKQVLGKIKIPSTVILIDDVITTGVTVETCASVLKSIGIKTVYVVSLFSVS